MTISKCLPSSFEAFKKKKKTIKNLNAKRLLNRFAYRYRLVRSFTGMNAPDVGKTLKGYDAIMKLFLANTAYEVIVKVANLLKLNNVKPLEGNARKNKELAEKIRDNKTLTSYLVSNSTDIFLQQKLTLMIEGRTNDIIPVCYAMRNVFAHGELTPSAIGLTTKKEYALIAAIADDILNYCDELFTECLANV